MSREDFDKMLGGICIVMACEDALSVKSEPDNRDTVAQALHAAHKILFSLYESLWDAFIEQEIKKHD